ncbi:protein kinase domain-containing protein [Frigoriglobus tundricola]|uniref:protein kinase domain-containing protein n=1 Tax=Frigoriglobus tundricola TaxID=2774151 RepID=UPI001D068327|nr:HDOD domain-containing protein [Frigoriglobus tundricola]
MELLATLLDPSRLPTPPAVALQVVNAASRPDCDPNEIIGFLGLDAALCGKLLKAVNSCLYGLKQPVASVGRAVQVLGLKTVRSLALGLSLPAVKVGRGVEKSMRDYWVSSVGGAILARELAVLARRPNPDDDLVAGLLRDLGEVLLRQAFADTWEAHLGRHADRLVDDPCGAEVESFGIDHADVSAELLRGWKLPDDIVEPIRYHHQPALLSAGGKVQVERAELLQFASQLVQLDVVAQRPDLLAQLLATAHDRFGMTRAALVEFLQRVAPKVESFAAVLNQDIGQCPDFAAILAAGATELVNLTVENSRDRLSGTTRVGATRRLLPAVPAAQTHAAPPDASPAPEQCLRVELPEFRPEFAHQLPECGCRLGGYELRSLLGRGAMGVVFKAFEPSLHRYVALKLLAPELAAAPSARQRFAREARVAAAIQHENVVAIYAVRDSGAASYLAMEYVAGSCLETRVQEHGPMPVVLHTATARQIAAGLAAAHAKQIIHRDIKPANILIEAETGRAKLTDFGLARVTDDARMTADGALIGTPFYMAPEIIQGEAATPLSDLFSLGAVYYLMATGRVPFPGQTVAAVFNAVSSAEPVPPRRARPSVPEWLDQLILRLLRKDPADRYPTAAAVAAVLAEHGG